MKANLSYFRCRVWGYVNYNGIGARVHESKTVLLTCEVLDTNNVHVDIKLPGTTEVGVSSCTSRVMSTCEVLHIKHVHVDIKLLRTTGVGVSSGTCFARGRELVLHVFVGPKKKSC